MTAMPGHHLSAYLLPYRLGIDQHPIQVEHDRLDHPSILPCRAAAIRIGRDCARDRMIIATANGGYSRARKVARGKSPVLRSPLRPDGRGDWLG